jgi:RNA recognition motif-containing protein
MPLQDDGRSSGTAIIEFNDTQSAAAALELNEADFDGRRLAIKYSTAKPILGPREASQKQEGCVTIFVGNLSWDTVDEDILREAFKGC